DGVKGGFDIEMLDSVLKAVNVPVIASGGAGKEQDFIDLFKALPDTDAALAASVFHFGEVDIKELKKKMQRSGIPVRL
ncbi:MAG: imidazole glycerol phosphate synthase subunit HisF, partial [Clostridia bacterium]|nr:imidazole glycerol phosphate synthase subunit HisF [Clostridia bacterium]